jgi:hypothetical protein
MIFLLLKLFADRLNESAGLRAGKGKGLEKISYRPQTQIVKGDGLVKNPYAALCFNPAPLDKNPAL